jgi:hypothetical protein
MALLRRGMTASSPNYRMLRGVRMAAIGEDPDI